MAEAVAERQVTAEGVAVEGAQVEAQVGRRTTYELVNNELELANARIALLQNQHDAYLAKVSVLAAMGLLEARNLSPGLDTYDPAKSLRHALRVSAPPWESAISELDRAGAPSTSPPAEGSMDAGSQHPITIDPQAPPDH
jgi:outer membrane protein